MEAWQQGAVAGGLSGGSAAGGCPVNVDASWVANLLLPGINQEGQEGGAQGWACKAINQGGEAFIKSDINKNGIKNKTNGAFIGGGDGKSGIFNEMMEAIIKALPASGAKITSGTTSDVHVDNGVSIRAMSTPDMGGSSIMLG